MYEIKPQSVKAFTEDRTIKLPRFQRRKTWKPKQNFLLCISLFKDYPVGVTIINKQIQDGKIEKWLLDGRQRRTAFAQILEDPENIYTWARKTIGFKVSTPESELIDSYTSFIDEYLEKEDGSKPNNDIDNSSPNSQDEDQDDSEGEFDTEGSDSVRENANPFIIPEKYITNNNQLDFLGQIILACHDPSTKNSGFTEPFNFSKYLDDLDYIEVNTGKVKVNGRKLKIFISQFRDFYLSNNEKKSVETFSKFILKRGKIKNTQNILLSFNTALNNNWQKINERISIYERIEEILENSYIGLIELNEATSRDSQKIFNIINTGGTQLTAAEILSAKASWNTPIVNPNPKAVEATKVLYESLTIDYTSMVKWDYPASLIYRLQQLESSALFFSQDQITSDNYQNSITLGFKILSAIYQDGIKKEDIEALSTNPALNWNKDIETVIQNFRQMFKHIAASEYFKYLNQWKQNIRSLLSDAILIDFLAILYKDAKRKEIFGGAGQIKKFQKNAFILIDQLIYEYVCRAWRGSSDGKIARNLKTFTSSGDEIFVPLDAQKWIDLMVEINTNFRINGEYIKSQKDVAPIVFHFYCLCKFSTINMPATSYEIDHIIPQEIIDNANIDHKESAKHALFNLELLSSELNNLKRSRKLNDLNNLANIDRELISHYSGIPLEQFDEFSSYNSFEKLQKFRSPKWLEAFQTRRKEYLM